MLVILDNPPVNTLDAAVRRGLLSALKQALSDDSVAALVVSGAGRAFSAGADIREFGVTRGGPDLTELCQLLESSPKLIVAAMHGFALGGALELALVAHHRIALAGTLLGLPEVKLGLIPGAGGTQRLPRLVGIKAAAELMLSGRSMSAEDARQVGLIDRISDGTDAAIAGVAVAQKILADGTPVRPTRHARALADAPTARADLSLLSEKLTQKGPGLFAPLKIIEALQVAIELPFDEGLKRERELFLECMSSVQRQALTHVFFAEREASKAPESARAAPRVIRHVGVVGGGTMGAGIAAAVLDGGLNVTLIERDEASLSRARAQVEKVFAGRIAKGSMAADSLSKVMERFGGTTNFEALAPVDLAIEAVYEDMSAKHGVFAQLDRICRPGAVLATNTSYLNIDEIAARISRPEDVVGLHFFSPAYRMKLLEIVVPAAADAHVVATAFQFAKSLHKVAVRAGVCDGFIVNRVMAVCRIAAEYVMEDGASPYEIDAAVREFGFAMGPFEVSDLAGGDIGWATRKRKAATRDPQARYVQVGDRLCERGWFGQKTGRGYYRYVEGQRKGVPDPEVLEIVSLERQRAGVTPRPVSHDHILRRYLAAMVNESANVVQEGIARRPLDVDVALIHGVGFPRQRGGPLHYADHVGLAQIRTNIEGFAQEDPRFWRLSPLLAELTSRSANFQSLNRGKLEKHHA